MADDTVKKVELMHPPNCIFVNQRKETMAENTINKDDRYFITTAVETPDDGGILVYQKGLKYPIKGFPFPEATNLTNMVKSNAILLLRAVGQKELWLSWLGFALTRWSKKIKIIEAAISEFNRMSGYFLVHIYMQDRYMTKCALGIRNFIFDFLKNIGISEDEAYRFALTVATIFEFDDAYRYRVEDLMDTVDKREWVRSPRKAILRLGRVAMDREVHGRMIPKINAFWRMAAFTMRHRKIRRAFSDAAVNMKLWMLQSDEADRYHMLRRKHYKFMGLSDEVRLDMWKKVHDGKLPEQYKIDDDITEEETKS